MRSKKTRSSGRRPDVRGKGRSLTSEVRASSNSRTRSTTLVPISSMLDMSMSCGSVPLLYLILKRDRPSIRAVLAILAATVSGEPTQSAPAGPASRSNCASVAGGHPRSPP